MNNLQNIKSWNERLYCIKVKQIKRCTYIGTYSYKIQRRNGWVQDGLTTIDGKMGNLVCANGGECKDDNNCAYAGIIMAK